MASSQDAQNVFYLFYERKILWRPKCKPYTGVLMPALGRLHQQRCAQIMHMSIHLPPRSIWYPGFLLHVNEPARRPKPSSPACCWAGLSAAGRVTNASPRRSAVHARTGAEGSTAITERCAVVALGGQSTGADKWTGDCLERFVLEVNQRQMKPGLGFQEEGYPVDTTLQRLLLAQIFLCLPYSAPLGATMLLSIYFILNCFKCKTSLEKAIAVESEGTYSALCLKEGLPSCKLPVK